MECFSKQVRQLREVYAVGSLVSNYGHESSFVASPFGALGWFFLSLIQWQWQGDLYDHEKLVKAIKQVDVVISTLGHLQLADQLKIIAAIKEAGNVKVVPSPNFILYDLFVLFKCFWYNFFL